MSFQHFFRQQAASSKVVGQKVNEAPIFTKNFPFLSGKFPRELNELEVSRRLVQFKSRHGIVPRPLCYETIFLASLVFAYSQMAKTLRLTEAKKDETSGSEKANRRRQAALYCRP